MTRSSRPRFQPRLEALEDRCTPSTMSDFLGAWEVANGIAPPNIAPAVFGLLNAANTQAMAAASAIQNAESRVVPHGYSVDRGAARPAADQPSRQRIRAQPGESRQRRQAGGLLAHRAPEQAHILAQPAIHQERAVARPGRLGEGDKPRQQRVGAGRRVAEHELAGPHQILAGIAVKPSLRNLARVEMTVGYVVFRLIGGTPTRSRLRYTVIEPEMLVPRLITAYIAIL